VYETSFPYIQSVNYSFIAMTRRHAGSSLAILFVLTWFTGGTCIKVKVNSPIVSTENGLIQGYQERSRGGRLFYSYVGIPFAKPPIGQLRFEVSYVDV